MSWDKPSDDLLEYLEDELSGYHCEKRKMFGCPVFFVNGNMFCGIFEATIFIRVSQSERDHLLGLDDEIVQFEPIAGQKMREYIILNDSFIHDRPFFNEWLNKSYEFVLSMPAKKPKKNK